MIPVGPDGEEGKENIKKSGGVGGFMGYFVLLL